MKAKPVSDSQTTMSQIMTSLDVNSRGNVHGGVIMKLVDSVAGIAAMRHARAITVTASIDRLDFLAPVHVGEIVVVRASVNLAGRTSMEVGVRVETEEPLSGKVIHVSSAYLTFVAMDKQRKPKTIPPLLAANKTDRRRHRDALARREIRLAERHH